MDVRDAITTAQNPIVFFDDDADGIASFLLSPHVLGKTLWAHHRFQELFADQPFGNPG